MILGAVDVQPTFMPGGELPVEGGHDVVPVINRLLQQHFRHAFASQDWHPAGHSSFASAHPGYQPFETIAMPYGPQVLWPDHALQDSANAALHGDFDTARMEVIVRKGFDPDIDSYSVFFENDHQTRTGTRWLAAQPRRTAALPRWPGHRFLRRLVRRGRGPPGFRGDADRGCMPRHRPARIGRLDHSR